MFSQAFAEGLDEANQSCFHGLKQAAGLPALNDLNLRLCQVSDAGLAHLLGKKTLRRLVVNREQFLEAALARFRQAVPKCELIQE